jgi:hypothetical protein
MLSTRDGVYGDTPDTRVPSAALLQALQKQPLHLYSTEETSAAKKRSADVIELSAPSTGPATFEP